MPAPAAPTAFQPPAETPKPPPVVHKARDTGAAAKRQLADARQKLAAGHYPEAKQAFTHLLDSRERAGALLGLSEIAFQQASYSDAARLAHQALSAGGGVNAHVLLGNAFFKQQKYAEAIREYKTVLRTQPNHAEARRGLEAAERRQAGR